MSANPSLTFANAVAIIKADDEQLRNTLRKDEAVVTESVGRMQKRFDKLTVSAKGSGKGAAAASKGVSALGSAASATGIPVLGAIAIWAQFAAQLKAFAAAAAGAVASVATLPVLAATAVAALIAAPRAIGLIQDKIVESRAAKALEAMQRRAEMLNDRLERQLVLRKAIDKARGVDVELATKTGIERGLILRLRAVEAEGKLLAQQRTFALDQRRAALGRRRSGSTLGKEDIAALARMQMANDRHAFLVQGIVARQERLAAAAGPQTTGQALEFLKHTADVAAARETRTRVLLEEFNKLGPNLQKLVRGERPDLFPGDKPTLAGQTTFLRRVEPGSRGDVVGVNLDRKRNDLLAKVGDKLDTLIDKADSGGFG